MARRSKKSHGILDISFTNPRKKRRSKGLLRAFDVKKKRKQPKGLIRFLGKDKKPTRGKKDKTGLTAWMDVGKTKRRGGFENATAASLRERLTPTERYQVQDAIEDARQNDPVVSAAWADAQAGETQRTNVVQRLVAYVRRRLSIGG